MSFNCFQIPDTTQLCNQRWWCVHSRTKFVLVVINYSQYGLCLNKKSQKILIYAVYAIQLVWPFDFIFCSSSHLSNVDRVKWTSLCFRESVRPRNPRTPSGICWWQSVGVTTCYTNTTPKPVWVHDTSITCRRQGNNMTSRPQRVLASQNQSSFCRYHT